MGVQKIHHFTPEGLALLGRHYLRWVATRVRDHAAGKHADSPSTLCPDCQRAGTVPQLEQAS